MKQVQVFLFVLLLSLFACKTEPQQKVEGDFVYDGEQVTYKGAKSGSVSVHFVSEPPAMHPTNTINTAYHIIRPYLYQSLVRIDLSNNQLVPLVAKDLPTISEDGLTMTYELHPDAKWADGTPITTADVLFSYKAALCPLTENAPYKAYLEFITDVGMPEGSPNQVYIQLKEKYILNEYLPTEVMILDKRLYDPQDLLGKFSVKDFTQDKETVSKDEGVLNWATEFNDSKYGRDLSLMTGGTGPYRVAEWLPEQQIILTKVDNYWGQNLAPPMHQQHPDSIIFRISKDDVATELEFKQEIVDVSFQLSTPTFEALRESDKVTANYNLVTKPKNSYVYIGLNTRPDGVTRKRIFDDKQVRQAMAHLMPLDDIISNLYPGGLAARVSSPVSVLNREYNQSLSPIPYDPDKAMQLLDAAGWSDSDNDLILDKVIDGVKTSLSFELLYPGGRQSTQDIVNRIVTALENAGVQCKTEGISLSQIREKTRGHDFDAALVATSSSSLPYDFKQVWHTSYWANNGDNSVGFGDAYTDDLIEKARRELDYEKRKPMVDEIQQKIYDEQAVIFFFNLANKMAVHKRFNNAGMSPYRYYIQLNNLEMVRSENM